MPNSLANASARARSRELTAATRLFSSNWRSPVTLWAMFPVATTPHPMLRWEFIPRTLPVDEAPTGRASGRVARQPGDLQVLPGVGDGVDGAARLAALLARDQGSDEHDALALLAGDARPVVGVSGVGQVLVLLELVEARGQQVLDPDALGAGLEQVLDRHLLRPVDDVLDHRAGVEIAEVQHFLVAIGVRDLEEAILVALGVHPLDRPLDHRGRRGLRVAAVFGDVVGVQRQVGGEVLAED